MEKLKRTEGAVSFNRAFYDFESGHLLTPVELQNYTVVQVAENYYRNSFQNGSHLQYCDLEITLSLSEGLRCSANRDWEKVDKDSAYLSFRGERHDLRSDGSCRFQTVAVNFKDNPNASLLNEIARKFTDTRVASLRKLTLLFSALVSEFWITGQPYSHQRMDALITEILVQLARSDLPAAKAGVLTTEEKLPAFMNYLDTHYLTMGSAAELSTQFGYTYSHICRVFQKQYGITPGVYLLNKKMERASALLAEGESVASVAEQLNYTSPYNFSRAFKKMEGLQSPGLRKRQCIDNLQYFCTLRGYPQKLCGLTRLFAV